MRGADIRIKSAWGQFAALKLKFGCVPLHKGPGLRSMKDLTSRTVSFQFSVCAITGGAVKFSFLISFKLSERKMF